MSSEARPYSCRYIRAWTVLSVILGLVFLGLFFAGDSLLQIGHTVWVLLRWLCRPII